MTIQLYNRLDADFENKRRSLEDSDQDDLSARLSRCTNNLCKGCVAGVYITTNESSADESNRKLMEKPRIAHACHVGFSGWHNFDIMAARRSEYGLICDFNPNNKKFIEATFLGLKRAESREEFIKIMGIGCDQIFRAGVDFFSPNMSNELDNEDEILLPSEEISRDAKKERSWLFSDESFNYIKELAAKGKITVITEDIRHTDTFNNIARLYHENGLVIDTVYTSNICDYMNTDIDKQAYASTVYSLDLFRNSQI